ncbi:MAG: hypothetical protein WAM09_08640 [Anaerolineales bacterium]|jgi:hypothetical protein
MEIDKTINILKQFILSIDLSGTPGQDLSSGFFFSTEDGGIILNREEVDQYEQCLQGIREALPNKELLSKKALEKMLQRAIILSLDPENKNTIKTRGKRTAKALMELKSDLLSAPRKFNIYYPVENLEIDNSPLIIGNVTFCIFDKKELRKFYSTISDSLQEKEKSIRMSLFDDLQNDALFNRPVAFINVEAVDSDAAKVIAHDELQKTLDVINFFVDLVFGKGVFVYIPGNCNKTLITVPMIIDGEKGGFAIMNERSQPLFPLNLNQFVEKCRQRNLGLIRAGELLKSTKNKFEERLFAAISWAGRATIEIQKEQAFLLYAIALETIILCDNDRDELNYRLTLRLAHLIGKEPNEGEEPILRKKVVKKAKDLYIARSQIVHTGNYHVTDAELYEIRQMTKLSILHILNLDPFISIQNTDELREWFDNEILK